VTVRTGGLCLDLDVLGLGANLLWHSGQIFVSYPLTLFDRIWVRLVVFEVVAFKLYSYFS
jgi:hypothetical protein